MVTGGKNVVVSTWACSAGSDTRPLGPLSEGIHLKGLPEAQLHSPQMSIYKVLMRVLVAQSYLADWTVVQNLA